jgi:hypothetical protein
MEFTLGPDTIATLLTIVVGVVGLGATVLASNRRTRIELKSDIAKLRTELKSDIGKLDDRVYALAAGLAPRLVPDHGDSSA